MSLSAPAPDYLNPPGRKSSGRARLRRAIFAADLVILLAPPIHWLFSGQSAFWYFLVANALVTLSLFALWATNSDEEDAA